MKKIIVTGLYQTEHFLKEAKNRKLLAEKACAIISITHSKTEKPSPFLQAGLTHLPNLLVWDVCDITCQDLLADPTITELAPTQADLETLIGFLRPRLLSKGGVFIHCAAGYSRSPAVAAVVLVLQGLNPKEALKEVTTKVAPNSRPNSLILTLADEALQLEGTLKKAGEDAWDKTQKQS